MINLLKTIKKSLGFSEERRKLEPEGYIVQANSWPEMAQKRILEEVSSLSQKGVSSIEITLNHPESLTPHAVREIKNFHEQEDVKVNIHASLQLRTAMAEKKSYKRVDEYMRGFIQKADEIGSSYVNVHTSLFPSPELGRMRGVMYEVMYHPDGYPIVDFLEELKDKYFDSETFEWIVRDLKKKVGVPQGGRIAEVISSNEEYLEDLVSEEEISMLKSRMEDDPRVSSEEVTREMARNRILNELMGSRQRILMKYREKDQDFKLKVEKDALREVIEEGDIDLERIFNEFRTYQLIGWWMYEKNDPIWRKICGKRSPKDLEEEKSMDLLVDAVAGRYIQGHVKNWNKELEGTDVVVTFETPDARESEFLGYYRLVNPKHIYRVVKAIDHSQIRLCFDFEHIATQGLNPKKILRETEDNIGEETYLVHLSSRPSPGHEHFPLQKGEHHLYEMLWELRKKGFERGYISFERGGGQGSGGEGDQVWKQSISIVKDMAMYLEDGISPGELPIEFYGYSDKEFKRDQAVVQSNTFEPIKGLIESPQMQDTFLGKHATETEPRMRGDGWKEEEHQ